MPDIRAVLFDYGLVLSGPPDPQSWLKLKTLLDVGEDEFHTAYWDHRDAYDRGALTGATYWVEVANQLHQSLDQQLLFALLETDIDVWTQPNVKMIAWAAALQRAGYKTAVLSNIGDAMEAGIRARFDWLQDFDDHTYSHRLRIAKPDLAIYRHAAEGLKEEPRHILFVDDRAENTQAAREAGMIAVQYTDHQAFTADMQALGLRTLLHPESGKGSNRP